MTARVKTVAPKKRATKRRTPPKLTIAGQEAVGTLCVVGSLPREWSESGVLRGYLICSQECTNIDTSRRCRLLSLWGDEFKEWGRAWR